MVWSCPWQILGAIRAEAASGGRAEILFFFRPLNNARFHRLPVGQISRNLHKKTCFRVLCCGLGNISENLPVRGIFPKKNSIYDFRNRFLRNDYKSWKVMTGWSPCGMLAFHWHRRNELKVIPLACSPRTSMYFAFGGIHKIYILKSQSDDSAFRWVWLRWRGCKQYTPQIVEYCVNYAVRLNKICIYFLN